MTSKHLRQTGCSANMDEIASMKAQGTQALDDSVRRCDYVGGVGWDPQAHQLNCVFAWRLRGVVGHEDDTLPHVAQHLDRFCRAGDGLFATPDNTIEIYEEGVESIGELHADRLPARRASELASAAS